MPELEIEVRGEVDESEIPMRMNILGELILDRIRQNIRAMGLIDTGFLLQNWIVNYSGGVLTIESATRYGQFLEYGTYEYWDRYGFEDYPDIPDPKKKELSAQAKAMFPKGVQPFAFVRKVLYNEEIMTALVSEAFS